MSFLKLTMFGLLISSGAMASDQILKCSMFELSNAPIVDNIMEGQSILHSELVYSVELRGQRFRSKTSLDKNNMLNVQIYDGNTQIAETTAVISPTPDFVVMGHAEPGASAGVSCRLEE